MQRLAEAEPRDFRVGFPCRISAGVFTRNCISIAVMFTYIVDYVYIFDYHSAQSTAPLPA